MKIKLDTLLEKLELTKNSVVYQHDILSWEKATSYFSSEICNRLQIINPTVVYFFNKTPFILFFDKNTEQLKNKDNKQIFREVWSWDKAPVIFIITETQELNIYNAFHYQKQKDNEKNQLEEIKISENEILKRFSFWELESGQTWKWLETNSNLNFEKRVNDVLLKNIESARKHLKQNSNLKIEFINILLLRLIFIRYLIDRDVIIDTKFIKGNNVKEKQEFFNQNIANQNYLNNFFDYLKERFNGNLFENSSDPKIEKDILIFLSNFFAANLPEKQLFIPYFDIFDFSIIPVETISGIYEYIIEKEEQKNNSAIYTPLFLVDYILENTVNKYIENQTSVNCKVLDPSCGSGIFLTQTFRRLVEKEKQLNNYQIIDDERLKQIVTQNIFGLDKDINALNVTAFSIYISLLDYKNPKEIQIFQLPNLFGKNLFCNDFFNEDDTILEHENQKYNPYNQIFKNIEFDFILGNPPWGSKKDKFHLDYIKKYELPITDFQISQTYLIRTRDFSIQNTKCVLIPSSGVLHQAKKFRNYFVKNSKINSILDMSAARFMIFNGAGAPAMVIFYENIQNFDAKNNVIIYSSLKPNIFLKNLGVLVIDNNEIKHIPQKYFNKKWSWKVALYGNIQDYTFLENLENTNKKIIDFISENNFKKGNGIIKGKKGKAHFKLINVKYLETNEITNYYTNITNKLNIFNEKDVNFARCSDELFFGNKILLRRRAKNLTDITISFIEEDCAIFNSAYAISANNSERNLVLLFGILISDLYFYFQFLTSANLGVFFPEINLNEHLAFPYREIKEKEHFIDLVNKFIDFYKNYYSQTHTGETELPKPTEIQEIKDVFKEINEIVNKTYNVTEKEELLVDYVLKVSRYQFQEGKLNKFTREPNLEELKTYAEVFYQRFESTYNSDEEYFQIKIYKLNYFTAMKFEIVKQKPTDENRISMGTETTEKQLFKILSDKFSIHSLTDTSHKIFVQKNLKGFEQDWFYIVKPNEYKCWHPAIAHRDAALFDHEIMMAESELMMEGK